MLYKDFVIIAEHMLVLRSARFGCEERTGHLLAMAGEDGHIAVVDTTQRTSDDVIPRG